MAIIFINNLEVMMSKDPTLAEIKRFVIEGGGSFSKEKFLLSGHDAYRVNGHTMTKSEMIDRYKHGEL